MIPDVGDTEAILNDGGTSRTVLLVPIVRHNKREIVVAVSGRERKFSALHGCERGADGYHSARIEKVSSEGRERVRRWNAQAGLEDAAYRLGAFLRDTRTVTTNDLEGALTQVRSALAILGQGHSAKS